MQQLFSIRSGALIVTSIRVACTLVFLLSLCIGTIKIERLEAYLQERRRQIKDGNDEITNSDDKGDQMCQFYGPVVLPCSQVKESKITCYNSNSIGNI